MDHSFVVDTESLQLPFPLREYQWQGVRFLLERESALLADDMGLGKTVQVSLALSLLFRDVGFRKAIVVVPASLRLNWERELQKWAPRLSARRVQGDPADRLAHYRLPVHVLIASYDQVRQDAEVLNKEVNFDVVILDEAQKIKNASSRTALACRTLQRRRSWALTGTPLENDVPELLSVFKFVRPGLLNIGLGRDELHTRMRPYFLRRVKSEVYEQLPIVTIQDLPIELSPKQRKVYDQLWNRRHTAGSDGQRLALITALKQVCNYDRASGESSKLETLTLLVEGIVENRGKMIVFSQYVDTLQWLKTRLEPLVPTGLFHGGLNEFDRDSVLSRFRLGDGPRVLLMSLTAGATGLNLQEASLVLFFDRWWNPAVESQALHRAYRFGRTQPLQIVKLTVSDTVEERIQEVLRVKESLFDQYVNTAGSATVGAFSHTELKRILGLDQ